MLSIQDTPVQAELRALARKFAQKNLAPIVEQDEAEGRFRPELIAELGKIGLTGIPVAEDYAGAGLGYSEYCVALEELAAVNAGYAISVAVTGLTQIILSLFGNEAQKKRYIPPLARGQAIGAFSLSEAGSGSDAAALRTTARREGDHYLVNGTKLWTTQGDIAETVLLLCRTGEAGPKGISALIIEKGMPGFKLGKREKKMGAHTSHTMELIFENCRVPAANLVGREGEGFKIAMTALDSGRITIAATANGLSRAALRIATHHAHERTQFGKPIGEFQGVSFMLADRMTEVHAAELLIRRAAALRDAGAPYTSEAAMAKLFATDTAMRTTTDAVQVLGGAGYTQDFPLERFMREAKVLQIVEGTNQIQRLILGRNLLQNPESLLG